MLGSCLTEINPEYHSVIKLAAMLTLVVETFPVKSVRNGMPTVLEFAYSSLFPPTIRETSKQLRAGSHFDISISIRRHTQKQ